ncbi:MAG: hypothetical protein ACYC4Q_12120, partial [Victivallaceae bacterium]
MKTRNNPVSDGSPWRYAVRVLCRPHGHDIETSSAQPDSRISKLAGISEKCRAQRDSIISTLKPCPYSPLDFKTRPAQPDSGISKLAGISEKCCAQRDSGISTLKPCPYRPYRPYCPYRP